MIVSPSNHSPRSTLYGVQHDSAALVEPAQRRAGAACLPGAKTPKASSRSRMALSLCLTPPHHAPVDVMNVYGMTANDTAEFNDSAALV